MTRAIITLCLSVALVLPATGAANAHVFASPEEAAALVEQAKASFSAQDYGTAIELFERAYALDPQPNLLFNIGRVYEETGELQQAVSYYKRFVNSSGVELRARETALERLRVLKNILAETQEQAEPEPASELRRPARDDSESIGLPDDEDGRETRKSPALEQDDLEAALAQHRRRKRVRAAGYSLAGIGGAALLAGAVLGALALQDTQKLYDLDLEARRSRIDAARDKAIAADVLFAAGGAVAGIGVVMLLATLGKNSSARAHLRPHPAGIAVRF